MTGRDRYSAGKRGGFNTFRDRENYTAVTLVCLREILGQKLRMVFAGAANYTTGSFGSNFVSAGIQTSFRTGNPTGLTRTVMIALSNMEVTFQICTMV